jgi:flagellar motor switch protein FliG
MPNIDLSNYAPTEITKLSIMVRVPEDTKEELLKEIEEIVINTSSQELVTQDQVSIRADLPLATSASSSLFNFRNVLLLIAFLLAMLIINNIRNSTRIIAKSLRRIKISNLDQLKLGETRDFQMFKSAESAANNQLSGGSNKPLQVKLLKDDDEAENTNLDFLNELSNSNFLSIVKNENPREIALILTQVEASKVDYFFKFYDGSIDEVLKHIIEMENILQLDMKIMVVGMYQKYLEALDKNPVKINNVKTMINFINSSSLSVAQTLFNKLKELKPEIAEQVKHQECPN